MKALYLPALLFAACLSAEAQYQFRFDGKTFTDPLVWSDANFEITFIVDHEGLNFQIHNKSKSTAKLDWNQCLWIDWNGNSHKVVGQGVKYIDRNTARPPSLIPAGAKLQDFFVPSHNVTYSDGWKVARFMPVCPACRELDGRGFRAFFVIEHEGKQRELDIQFKIKAVN